MESLRLCTCLWVCTAQGLQEAFRGALDCVDGVFAYALRSTRLRQLLELGPQRRQNASLALAQPSLSLDSPRAMPNGAAESAPAPFGQAGAVVPRQQQNGVELKRGGAQPSQGIACGL